MTRPGASSISKSLRWLRWAWANALVRSAPSSIAARSSGLSRSPEAAIVLASSSMSVPVKLSSCSAYFSTASMPLAEIVLSISATVAITAGLRWAGGPS